MKSDPRIDPEWEALVEDWAEWLAADRQPPERYLEMQERIERYARAHRLTPGMMEMFIAADAGERLESEGRVP